MTAEAPRIRSRRVCVAGRRNGPDYGSWRIEPPGAITRTRPRDHADIRMAAHDVFGRVPVDALKVFLADVVLVSVHRTLRA